MTTRRILPAAVLVASLGVSAARGEPPVELIPAPLPLAWVHARADAASPRLARTAAERDAARARVGPAGSLDDPRVAYEASNVPLGDFDFASTPLSGHQLGLRQRLPFPGLLGVRREAARAAAHASERAHGQSRLDVDAVVEDAWSELGFAQRARGITRRNLALLRQLARTAEAKYRVGEGLQQDVLRSHVEVTALLSEELRRDAAVIAAEARLRALLDLPPQTFLPETEALDETSSIPAVAPLLAALDARSPALRALEARVEETRRAVRVVELEGHPDFDLGIGYRVRRAVRGDPVAGDDFLSAGLTVRLPVNRGKWRALVASARADHRRAVAAHREGRARLGARVEAAHAELVRADAEGRLVETGLLPQARQSLESSRSGYQVGRVDFPSLLDSQVRLLTAELRRVRAQADRRSAFAALEAAAGEKLR